MHLPSNMSPGAVLAQAEFFALDTLVHQLNLIKAGGVYIFLYMYCLFKKANIRRKDGITRKKGKFSLYVGWGYIILGKKLLGKISYFLDNINIYPWMKEKETEDEKILSEKAKLEVQLLQAKIEEKNEKMANDRLDRIMSACSPPNFSRRRL